MTAMLMTIKNKCFPDHIFSFCHRVSVLVMQYTPYIAHLLYVMTMVLKTMKMMITVNYGIVSRCRLICFTIHFV